MKAMRRGTRAKSFSYSCSGNANERVMIRRKQRRQQTPRLSLGAHRGNKGATFSPYLQQFVRLVASHNVKAVSLQVNVCLVS